MEFLPFTLGPLFFAICLSVCMLGVMVYDARHYIIPNALNAAVIALYPLGAFFLGLDFVSALMAAGIMLLAGFAIFALGFMGGGDVKLLVALSLWAGLGEGLVQLLFLMAICGGVLALLCIILRRTLGRVWHRVAKKTIRPRMLTSGEPIPYGIAIAAAFLWLLWQGYVPGLAV